MHRPDCRRANIVGALCALALIVGHSAPVPAQARPKLIVLITVDQLRADYLTRFRSQLTGGFARLSEGGAWFTNAHHDHAITETAPGHATLLAGRFPRSTGIMMNRSGVEDDSSRLIANGYGPGASPRRFVGTTLVDWLAASDPGSRALSVSTKDRGAILPIGRSKAEVYWYSPDGRFVTSKYYRDTLPTWVNAFNDQHLPQRYAGCAWSLLLPERAYSEPDSVEAEGNGVDFQFPHLLPSDSIDVANMVRGTPFIDEVTVAFALHGIQALKLGASGHTDVLAMSLSAMDYVGHRYGADSREMHDEVLRADRVIGTFLDSLYKLRDSSTITIALTGDHGAGSMPELAPKDLQPRPTRVTLSGAMPAVRAGLAAAHVDTMAIDVDVQIVFADRAEFARAKVNADSALAAFATAVRAIPGVARVDRFKDLLKDTLTDPIARRWSHQFPSDANVELVITLTPLSLWGRGTIASHGSPRDYDSNVPLIFAGMGVRPGKHGEFVRTVDLAPTLAAIAGAKPLERLDGAVLNEAVLSPNRD